MEFIQIEVEARKKSGSGHARRLRRDGRVPANLYGLGRETMSLAMDKDDILAFLRSGSHLIELKMADKTRPAIVREVQIDPLTDEILHLDFHRVDADVAVEAEVPVVLKGRPKGVAEGGLLTTLLETVRVSCKPTNIPKEFLVDVSEMAMGDQLHASDLEIPDQVELVDDGDEIIALVAVPREADLGETDDADEPAEPEVVGKGAESDDDDED